MGPGRGAGFSGQPGAWPQVPPVEAARAPGRQLLPDQTPRLPEGCSRTCPGAGTALPVFFLWKHGRCGWEPWGPLTQPGPSPSGGVPAERGCSEGRPVLALEPRRAPDRCPRISPWGSSHLGGGCPCSRCRMVFPLGCGEGPLFCFHAPPHGSRQGCLPPADVDPPHRQTPGRKRSRGVHVCQVSSEGPE